MISKPILVAFGTLICAACFGAGYFVGQDTYVGPKRDPRSWQESVYARYYPNVQDAMKRWAAKDDITVERAMEGRSIEMMHFPDRDCVQFQIPTGSVGGVPIYCYQVDKSENVTRGTTKLIFEHSDVE